MPFHLRMVDQDKPYPIDPARRAHAKALASDAKPSSLSHRLTVAVGVGLIVIGGYMVLSSHISGLPLVSAMIANMTQ